MPIAAVGGVHEAVEICRMWAERWLEAHELDADLTPTSSSDGTAGVTWDIEVGRAHSTTPGVGQSSDWTWSARVHDWARSLRQFARPARGGRVARSTDADGAEVVRLFGDDHGLREDRGSGVGMGIGDPNRLPGADLFFETPISAGQVTFVPGDHAVPYTLEGAPPSSLCAGPPSGLFRITGPGLPPGGVEGQADPSTGPMPENIIEALNRGDVMAKAEKLGVDQELVDPRPPWLRRADGWDEDDLGEGVPPGLEPQESSAQARLERQAHMLGLTGKRVHLNRQDPDQ